MKVVLVLCALVAVSIATPVVSNPQSRIIGGTTAAPGQFPHSASVRNFDNVHLCGGFIHSARWIITVAFCVFERTISNTQVVVGTNHLSRGGFDYSLSRVISHPNFNANVLDNDIALLETVYAIDWYTNVQPIPLATTTTLAGITGTLAGWGHLENDGAFAEDLQWVTKRTVSNDECRNRHPEANAEHITERMFCTDNEEGMGNCTGDGGSALVSGAQAIGIASWGAASCATTAPDVYTRIAYHIPWINGIINA